MPKTDFPRIPINRPTLATIHSVSKYILRMDESHIYSNRGPLLQEFEQRIADLLLIPAECVVACSSATLAIEGVIASVGGSSHILPDYTFAATGLATINAKTRFQLSDIDFETLTLRKEGLSSKGSDHPVPIFVAPFGAKIDIEFFDTSPIGIIDAAASLGQTIQNPIKIPSGWGVVFSLHATKVLGAGEGGVAVFGDNSQAEDFRSYINFGYRDGRIGRTTGTNGKMSEITAAYALAALDNLLVEEAEWKTAHSIARAKLKSLPVKTFHSENDLFQPYLIIRLENESQFDRVTKEFERNNIETRSWWAEPLHKMPAFQKTASGSTIEFPITNLAAKTVLGLPMFRGLSSDNVIRISNSLENALT